MILYFPDFSHVMGIAADCWLAYMDQLLTVQENKGELDFLKTKMLELVDIYYDALDGPKTGNEVIFNYGHKCFVVLSSDTLFFTVCVMSLACVWSISKKAVLCCPV